MPRKVGQDMIVRKKTSGINEVVSRTSRNIIASQKNNNITIQKNNKYVKKMVPQENIQSQNNTKKDFFSYEPEIARPIFHDSDNKKPVRGGTLWIFVCIGLITLFFTVISLFSRTTINLELQRKSYSINNDITLAQESLNGQVPFKTAQVIDRQSILVPTTERKNSDTYATGTVRLFSKNSKTTIIPAGTELTSSQGKKFKTTNAVTIPKGTDTSPGSIDVTVQAILSGADSNIKLDDLSLSRFPAIIARTITEISGGNSGEQPFLSEAQFTEAKTSLQTIMERNEPITFLSNQIPDQYWIPPSLVHISDISYHTEPAGTGVTVVAERTIIGAMIDRSIFHQFLIDTFIPESDRSYTTITETSNLVLNGSINNKDISTIIVRLSGTFIGQATIDETVLRSSIARQKKNTALTVLQSVPGVLSVTIHQFPPWMGTIPDQVSKIIFKINYQLVK